MSREQFWEYRHVQRRTMNGGKADAAIGLEDLRRRKTKT